MSVVVDVLVYTETTSFLAYILYPGYDREDFFPTLRPVLKHGPTPGTIVSVDDLLKELFTFQDRFWFISSDPVDAEEVILHLIP